MRIPALSIIILFVVSFLIDLYISIDVKQLFGKNWRNLYFITALLCWALLIVTISLPRRDAGSGISVVMWLLFTYLSIYLGKLVYIICSAIGRLVRSVARIKWDIYPSRWIGLLLGASFCGIMWTGAAYTRHHIMIVDEEFYSPKLPESFDNYKIVQLSDLHVGTWGADKTFLQNLVDTVNSLKPDLIVFTGDIVNRQASELVPFIDVLSKFKAKDGIYSILGNHDYGDYVDWNSPAERDENNRRLAQIEHQMGWKLLNNESVFVRNGSDSILLIGVENWGEPPFPVYGDLNRAATLQQQNDYNYKILLSHNPEHWNREVSKKTNIDLTLSGHTHAMQAIIKFGKWKWSPAKYRYEQWGGRYSRLNPNGEATSLYVNTGAGAVGMPARLMAANPEVTLITLKKGELH